MEDALLDSLPYTIPSIVTGLVAYYFFLNHTRSEAKRMKIELLKEQQKTALPLKLQAYERMILFLERISPAKLLLRVSPLDENLALYSNQLLQHIEQEFEHNLAQQIYLSDESWNAIITAKNEIAHLIKNTADLDEVKNAQELRELILKKDIAKGSSTQTSISILKDDVKLFL